MKVKIKKGRHLPTKLWRFWDYIFPKFGNGRIFNLMVHRSWLTTQYDHWNKICGWSYGWTLGNHSLWGGGLWGFVQRMKPNHGSSDAIAIRPNGSSTDKLDIAIYSYVNGERMENIIGYLQFPPKSDNNYDAFNNYVNLAVEFYAHNNFSFVEISCPRMYDTTGVQQGIIKKQINRSYKSNSMKNYHWLRVPHFGGRPKADVDVLLLGYRSFTLKPETDNDY